VSNTLGGVSNNLDTCKGVFNTCGGGGPAHTGKCPTRSMLDTSPIMCVPESFRWTATHPGGCLTLSECVQHTQGCVQEGENGHLGLLDDQDRVDTTILGCPTHSGGGSDTRRGVSKKGNMGLNDFP